MSSLSLVSSVMLDVLPDRPDSVKMWNFRLFGNSSRLVDSKLYSSFQGNFDLENRPLDPVQIISSKCEANLLKKSKSLNRFLNQMCLAKVCQEGLAWFSLTLLSSASVSFGQLGSAWLSLAQLGSAYWISFFAQLLGSAFCVNYFF